MGLYEECKAKLAIDKNNLDIALVEHSQLVAEINEHYANAVDRRDSSAEILKGKDAEISLRIRQNATSTQEKITEDKAKAMVLADNEHKMQANLALNCSKEASMWQALVKAADARTRMLGALVELHKSGYWSSGIQSGHINNGDYNSARTAEVAARENK